VVAFAVGLCNLEFCGTFSPCPLPPALSMIKIFVMRILFPGLRSMAVVLGASCLLIAWQEPAGSLAIKISRSSNFIKWNKALSDFDKENKIALLQHKGSYKRIPEARAELDAVMNNPRMNSAEKKDSMNRIMPMSESMRASLRKSRDYMQELNKEFPELKALSPEGIKNVFGQALKLCNKARYTAI